MPTVIGRTNTNDQGLYRFTLPDGVTEGACPPLVVQVGSGAGSTRALVFSTTDAIDIDFASEAAVNLIANKIGDVDGDVCAYTPRDVRKIVDMIRQKPGFVPGSTAAEVNANATAIASQDEEIQAAVAAPIAPFTPTPTRAPAAHRTRAGVRVRADRRTATPAARGPNVSGCASVAQTPAKPARRIPLPATAKAPATARRQAASTRLVSVGR